MTPFEIAISIRGRPDNGESVEEYVLRAHAQERMQDFGLALEMMIGWEQAYDDFEALLDCLKAVERKEQHFPIQTLVERKRQLGYDAKLESLLARQWRCPHCKQFTTIMNAGMPMSDPDSLLRCITCGEEGVYPVEPRAQVEVHDGGKSGLRPI